MSGLWRRLADRDGNHAKAIARTWMEHEALLFRRLGYWAATISEHGPMVEAATVLAGLTAETFWLREITPNPPASGVRGGILFHRTRVTRLKR